ncbi:hypothetical protein ACROYT_G001253 [Oculina patagonica]
MKTRRFLGSFIPWYRIRKPVCHCKTVCLNITATSKNVARLDLCVSFQSIISKHRNAVGSSDWIHAKLKKMALRFSLLLPKPQESHDQNGAEKWKKFNLAWKSYAQATELNKRLEAVQVTTLLTVIGEDDVYSTFTD